jgi:hypothetical protein
LISDKVIAKGGHSAEIVSQGGVHAVDIDADVVVAGIVKLGVLPCIELHGEDVVAGVAVLALREEAQGSAGGHASGVAFAEERECHPVGVLAGHGEGEGGVERGYGWRSSGGSVRRVPHLDGVCVDQFTASVVCAVGGAGVERG